MKRSKCDRQDALIIVFQSHSSPLNCNEIKLWGVQRRPPRAVTRSAFIQILPLQRFRYNTRPTCKLDSISINCSVLDSPKHSDNSRRCSNLIYICMCASVCVEVPAPFIFRGVLNQCINEKFLLSPSISASPAELGYLPWDSREGPCAGPVSSLCALIMAPGTERALSHPRPYVLD